jgi:hypothetical protein
MQAYGNMHSITQQCCNIPKMRNLVNCAWLSSISMGPTWIPKYAAAAVAFLAGQPPPLLSSTML